MRCRSHLGQCLSQMDHSSFQQIKHPSYMLLRRKYRWVLLVIEEKGGGRERYHFRSINPTPWLSRCPLTIMRRQLVNIHASHLRLYLVSIVKRHVIDAIVRILCPRMTPIVSAFQLLGEGVLTNHELVVRDWPEEVRHTEKFVCSVYSAGVQLPYQLCVGNCLGPGVWRARSFLRSEQHWCPISYEPSVWLWETKVTQPLTHAYSPYRKIDLMLAEDEYVPLLCLYKLAPITVLELIKCGCKTSFKGHCSCKSNLPCTALWNTTILIPATFLPTGW